MFEYFSTAPDGSLNVYKIIDISDIQLTENYTYHDVVEGENLMSISYLHYNTKDNWWIIFLFNNVYDANFFNINDVVISDSTDYYLNSLVTYNLLSSSDKADVKFNITNYFKSFNNLKDSIILANQAIANPTLYLSGYKDYIVNLIINNSVFIKKLKIPNSDIVYAIKNRMDTYSISWKINN